VRVARRGDATGATPLCQGDVGDAEFLGNLANGLAALDRQSDGPLFEFLAVQCSLSNAIIRKAIAKSRLRGSGPHHRVDPLDVVDAWAKASQEESLHQMHPPASLPRNAFRLAGEALHLWVFFALIPRLRIQSLASSLTVVPGLKHL